MMSYKTILSIVVGFFYSGIVFGQSESYTVKKAPFSSDRYDEVCPVFYKQGIVFCSDRDPFNAASYSSSEGKGFLKIYYVDNPSVKSWRSARLFAKELTTRLNDGPVTFSRDGKDIYFARNLYTEGKASEISGSRNKLGVFHSQLAPEGWKEPRELRYNNEWYNITSPCISPDGKKLFFASDKPGGYGGSDLYYCQWEDVYWGNPVNMGPVINTSGNEVYPFICNEGEIYFSSDGHQGAGGKDIFYSRCIDSVWLEPICLDAPINSPYDDIGITTDNVMRSGYFSSNRNGTYDIFSFETNSPQLFYCSPQLVNQSCFSFKDDDALEINPETMFYAWSFGDESITPGDEIVHCFPGPGKYHVEEFVIDRITGKKIFVKQSYDLEIHEIEQPFISGPDFALLGEELRFNGLKSYMPGYEVTDYFWDFGDGTRSAGNTVLHTFNKAGNFDVKLGIVMKNLTNGELMRSSVYKTVKVFNDPLERESFLSFEKNREKSLPNISDYDHAFISNYSATSLEKNTNFQFEVQVAESKERLNIEGEMFRGLASRYTVKEIYQPSTRLYRYIVAEETNYLRAAVILQDMFRLGYGGTVIKAIPVTDPAELELFNLESVYGKYADYFFGSNDSRLTSGGFAYLDQVLQLLQRHPDVKLVVESFTDRTGRTDSNLTLSRQRAQTIVNYFTGKGIDYKRLIAKGYGDSRPLALKNTEQEKRMNQRIDLMLLK